MDGCCFPASGGYGLPAMPMPQGTQGCHRPRGSGAALPSMPTMGGCGPCSTGQPITVEFTPPGLMDGAKAAMTIENGRIYFSFTPPSHCHGSKAAPIELDYETCMSMMCQAMQPGAAGDAARATLRRWGINPDAFYHPASTTGARTFDLRNVPMSMSYAAPGLNPGATATLTEGKNGKITIDPDGAGPAKAVTVDQDTYSRTVTLALEKGSQGDAARARLRSWGFYSKYGMPTIVQEFAPPGYDTASAKATASFEAGGIYYHFDKDGAGPAKAVTVDAQTYYKTLQDAGEEGIVGDKSRAQLREWGFTQAYVDSLKPQLPGIFETVGGIVGTGVGGFVGAIGDVARGVPGVGGSVGGLGGYAIGSAIGDRLDRIFDDRDDVTATELKLQADARFALRDDPAASAAFDKLVKNEDFKNLGSDTRVAVLSQVWNFSDKRSIENLELLTGRDWFQDASLGDQQRSAKIIALASRDSTGNTTIKDNTLHFILTNDDVDLKWDHIPTAGQTSGYKLLSWRSDLTITLNRDLVPDGNGSPAGNFYAEDIGKRVLAHEVNHALNFGANDGYRYFMDEYRAWHVGFEAANGRPPSQQECFNYAQFLVTSTQGAYGYIGDTFRNAGSDESSKIVRFMARIIGADPATANNTSVLSPGTLSTTGGGLVPEAADGDDPNNLDNHN